MSFDQCSFAFRRAQRSAELLPVLLHALSDGAWHRGRDLCRLLETNDRTLRQLASDSNGAIVSGQRGYKATAHATTKEIDHAENFYRSQARQMLRRAIQVRKARNHRGEAVA